MKISYIIIRVVLVFLILIGGFFLMNSNNQKNKVVNNNENKIRLESSESNVDNNQENINSESTQTTLTNQIKLSELSIHNKESDCWISYNNDVYDITNYIGKHPGGKNKIIPYCGTAEDFESAFTGKHETSKVSILEGLTYKGELLN
ncbi:MAG: cytochrome b5-like heme/steroid binding domain-containing protein [Candidatus Pacearchaeota archaeon]|jgi:cytochrome b involved in lipid metabolism